MDPINKYGNSIVIEDDIDKMRGWKDKDICQQCQICMFYIPLANNPKQDPESIANFPWSGKSGICMGGDRPMWLILGHRIGPCAYIEKLRRGRLCNLL